MWNVPTAWGKSQPKDVLVKRFRERAEGDDEGEDDVIYERVGEEPVAGPSNLASSSGSVQGGELERIPSSHTPLTSPITTTPPSSDIRPENIALPADEPEQENVPPTIASGWDDIGHDPASETIKPLPAVINNPSSNLNGSVLGKSRTGRGIPQPMMRGLSSGMMESGLPVAGGGGVGAGRRKAGGRNVQEPLFR